MKVWLDKLWLKHPGNLQKPSLLVLDQFRSRNRANKKGSCKIKDTAMTVGELSGQFQSLNVSINKPLRRSSVKNGPSGWIWWRSKQFHKCENEWNIPGSWWKLRQIRNVKKMWTQQCPWQHARRGTVWRQWQWQYKQQKWWVW
jgi:hypothetical protein